MVGMPRMSVNTSLQIEPPICGTIAGLTLEERCSEPGDEQRPGMVRLGARGREAAVVGRRRRHDLDEREAAWHRRCRCSAGMTSSASVPATKRSWQLATALGGMALTGRPGVPVVKARMLNMLEP